MSAALLVAIGILMDETARVLSDWLFDVRVPNVIVMLDAGGKCIRRTSEPLAKWYIEDAHTRRVAVELKELAELCQTIGFEAEDFVLAWQNADQKKPTGPPPGHASKIDRVTRLLKERWPVAAHGNVRRLVDLLTEHRSDIFPPPEKKK